MYYVYITIITPYNPEWYTYSLSRAAYWRYYPGPEEKQVISIGSFKKNILKYFLECSPLIHTQQNYMFRDWLSRSFKLFVDTILHKKYFGHMGDYLDTLNIKQHEDDVIFVLAFHNDEQKYSFIKDREGEEVY